MKFGSVPLYEARGAIMAHSQKVGDRMIRKGSLLDEAALDALRNIGRTEVICATLEPGDGWRPPSSPRSLLGRAPRRDG
jgi:molybdenum cofactor cytidylyltransferase